ncbi:MAG TPA: energy transducer TonB [Methylibium sp.]
MSTLAQNPMVLAGPGRGKAFKPKSRFGPVGIVVMVGFHLLLGYALMSGLARKAVQIVKRPLDATIIEEVKLPPPPPPPPPPRKIVTETPKVDAPPPPAYVPPPEVTPPATAQPAITAVQNTEALAPPLATPAMPIAPVPAGPIRQDIAVACQRQVKPVIPQHALDEGIGGTVVAEIRIRGGRVAEVQITSGPRIYHAAVKAAVMQYQCTSDANDIVATQTFEFKVD